MSDDPLEQLDYYTLLQIAERARAPTRCGARFIASRPSTIPTASRAPAPSRARSSAPRRSIGAAPRPTRSSPTRGAASSTTRASPQGRLRFDPNAEPPARAARGRPVADQGEEPDGASVRHQGRAALQGRRLRQRQDQPQARAAKGHGQRADRSAAGRREREQRLSRREPSAPEGPERGRQRACPCYRRPPYHGPHRDRRAQDQRDPDPRRAQPGRHRQAPDRDAAAVPHPHGRAAVAARAVRPDGRRQGRRRDRRPPHHRRPRHHARHAPSRMRSATSAAFAATARPRCPWTRRWSPARSICRAARSSCGRCRCPRPSSATSTPSCAEVFFEGFVRGAQCNLHMQLHEGENLHHIIEISFKALARALRDATELDPRVTRRAVHQGHALRVRHAHEYTFSRHRRPRASATCAAWRAPSSARAARPPSPPIPTRCCARRA